MQNAMMQAFSQGVKTGRPENTVGVTTYFHEHGKKTWSLKSAVVYS
jgi:hypothetical protein